MITDGLYIVAVMTPMNIVADIQQNDTPLLDLLSTSQKMGEVCINHAPFICVPETDGKPGILSQGCCNSWQCPRCGQIRARHEYGRIVEGARKLAESETLWFLTITCIGGTDYQSAEKSYMLWTNRLLSVCRAHAKKHRIGWYYAQVTERQKRGFPHSHFLSTFCPIDAFNVIDDYTRYTLSVSSINEQIDPAMRFTADKLQEVNLLDYHSEWFMLACVKVGLGVQARISITDSVEACSRYIAKYLFKDMAFEEWPKHWKRVRYSQSWPKLPEKSNPLAFPVLSNWDWYIVRDSGKLITTSNTVYEMARHRGAINVGLKAEI